MDNAIRPTRRITRHHLTHPDELVGLLVGRRSPRRIKVDYRLRFLHEVFKFEHFHCRLGDGEELTVEGLKSAQGRYPRLFGLGRRLFRRPLEKAARNNRLLDSEEFKERMRYLLMLLRSEST